MATVAVLTPAVGTACVDLAAVKRAALEDWQRETRDPSDGHRSDRPGVRRRRPLHRCRATADGPGGHLIRLKIEKIGM